MTGAGKRLHFAARHYTRLAWLRPLNASCAIDTGVVPTWAADTYYENSKKLARVKITSFDLRAIFPEAADFATCTILGGSVWDAGQATMRKTYALDVTAAAYTATGGKTNGAAAINGSSGSISGTAADGKIHYDHNGRRFTYLEFRARTKDGTLAPAYVTVYSATSATIVWDGTAYSCTIATSGDSAKVARAAQVISNVETYVELHSLFVNVETGRIVVNHFRYVEGGSNSSTNTGVVTPDLSETGTNVGHIDYALGDAVTRYENHSIKLRLGQYPRWYGTMEPPYWAAEARADAVLSMGGASGILDGGAHVLRSDRKTTAPDMTTSSSGVAIYTDNGFETDYCALDISSASLWLFASGVCNLRFRRLCIYDFSGNTLRDFVPALDADGTPGVWDLIRNRFHGASAAAARFEHSTLEIS